MRRLTYLVVVSLVALLVALPFAGAQETVTVSMEDNFFDQANITVERGTTVTWVQNGENPHTTTSYDGLWDSGMMAGGSGSTSSYTFDETGTFDYYCIPHEEQGMVGSVTVVPADDDATEGTGGAQYTDDASDDQYAGDDEVAGLPDTGGPGLLAVAALLVLCGGGLAVTLRSPRRDS